MVREGLESALTPHRTWREISLEPPEDSLSVDPVPEGMRAWKNRKNGFTVVACHYSADPDKRNNTWYNKACQNLREDQIERELEINFESKAGMKAFGYLEHNSGIFRLDPPDPIPPNWHIIAGLDYGARNPTSIHLYAIDEFRRFWSFDEFYKPSNVVEIATWLKSHRYWRRVRKVVADPKIFARDQNIITKETGAKAYGTVMSVAELLTKQGIHNIQRGNNDRIAGLERMRLMFNWRGDAHTATPFFFIGRKCEKQWWELCNLVHKRDEKADKNAEEDVVKRNDHAFDEGKYALLSEDVPAEALPPSAKGSMTIAAIEQEIDERYNQDKDPFSCSFHEFDDEDYGESYL